VITFIDVCCRPALADRKYAYTVRGVAGIADDYLYSY
jgi:hypothetical protein